MSILAVLLVAAATRAEGNSMDSTNMPHSSSNRLAGTGSPYLRHHAGNPVDWYPWGEDAFERARREDKPVFLSVGYAACHWCHVMARESFENEEVAGLLNRSFVSIKVDREERPDIDALYMQAAQMMTGRGGWPLSFWLTPDGRPWYAGTYFPPEDRGGMAGFKTVLNSLADAWINRRNEVEQQAGLVARNLEALGRVAGDAGGVAPEYIDELKGELRARYDRAYGGFGDAPKFPPHNYLLFIFHDARRVYDPALLNMALDTLDRIARGGVTDHIGGGFHRYATDEQWKLPHFEKMLYDNGMLLWAYAEAYRYRKSPLFRLAAQGIADWLEREMQAPGGAFYASLDADSSGEEGLFYTWTDEELRDALDDMDYAWVCDVLHVRAEGNYRDEATGRDTGRNVLYVKESSALFDDRWSAIRGRLLNIRNARPRPARDEKIIAAWNGLAIRGLAHAGQVFDEPDWTRRAARAADAIMAQYKRDGMLARTVMDGKTGPPGFLDDYAAMAWGLLALYEAEDGPRRLEQARELLVAMRSRFADAEGGGFFLTEQAHDRLLTRNKDPFDGALPAGNAMAAHAMIGAASGADRQADLKYAEQHLRTFVPLIKQAPLSMLSYVSAVSRFFGLLRDDGPPAGSIVKLQWREQMIKADPGDEVRAVLEVSVPMGKHVTANDPGSDTAIPFTVGMNAAVGVAMKSIDYPEGEWLEFPDGSRTRVYTGRFTVPVVFTVADFFKYRSILLPFTVAYQVCDDRSCFDPRKEDMPIKLDVHFNP